MSNMSYCRFQNTSSDFQDCIDNLRSLTNEPRDYNDEEERRARARIIRAAADMLVELGIDDPSDSHAIDAVIYELDSEPPVENDDD